MKKVVFVLWFLIGFYGLFGQTSTKKIYNFKSKLWEGYSSWSFFGFGGIKI